MLVSLNSDCKSMSKLVLVYEQTYLTLFILIENIFLNLVNIFTFFFNLPLLNTILEIL